MRRFLGVLALLALSCVDRRSPIAYWNADPNAQRPYSDAVRVGDLLFLSGKLGTDPATGQLVPGGITSETRQTLENIKRTLEANGSSMERVVKCTVMLADISEWDAMNAVYRGYFPQKPARSALGVNGLVRGARVEIECVAVVTR